MKEPNVIGKKKFSVRKNLVVSVSKMKHHIFHSKFFKTYFASILDEIPDEFRGILDFSKFLDICAATVRVIILLDALMMTLMRDPGIHNLLGY